MDLGIANKRAVVTAAGSGLGRAIASTLAREGARVAVVARTAADVESFVSEHGNQHVGVALDLVPEGAPQVLVAHLCERFGEPDIVVHNLGGAANSADPLCGTAAWREVYRLNVEVGVELNLLLIPHMRSQGWGRIVHTSSIAALENQGTVPYCSMKAALVAYTRSIGRFLAPDGIVVSTVLPGAVLTEGGYWDVAKRERPEHVAKYLQERMAIRRFGRPEEIASITAFLCSEHASFIAGSAFLVDGGQGRAFQFE